MSYLIANAENMASLIKDSSGRNRGPYESLLSALDPDGVSVAAFHMIHNGMEVRALWYVKMKGEDAPVQIWMDNDIAVWSENTQKGPDAKEQAPDGGESNE